MPKPLNDDAFLQFDPAEARLGQLLFYDPILSGNRNISCATCHNPAFGTGDGLALGIGEGGVGVGTARTQGSARIRQSRNAPALWNLSAREVRVLFHDGRVEQVADGFQTPAGSRLPTGLNSVLAAQALFPLLARTEMAGDPEDNEIAAAAVDNAQEAWGLIAARVQTIPEYRRLFRGLRTDNDVKISHVVNALAAYIDVEFRAQNTPFDAYLATGDESALSPTQFVGMELFYGKARCSTCHSGALFSDQSFHSLGLPQFGPAQTRRFDPVARDVGRLGVSNDLTDAYRFRTPFLRNVTRTAPYGHNGAFPTLDEMIRQHANPTEAAVNWTPDMVRLPNFDGGWDDFAISKDPIEALRVQRSVSITPIPLSEAEIAALVAFLGALESPKDRAVLGRPNAVPSGLPFD